MKQNIICRLLWEKHEINLETLPRGVWQVLSLIVDYSCINIEAFDTIFARKNHQVAHAESLCISYSSAEKVAHALSLKVDNSCINIEAFNTNYICQEKSSGCTCRKVCVFHTQVQKKWPMYCLPKHNTVAYIPTLFMEYLLAEIIKLHMQQRIYFLYSRGKKTLAL